MNRLKHLIVVVTLVLVSNAFAQGMDHSQMGQSMQEPMQMGSGNNALAELQGEEFEIGFMSMMIVHHQGAIEMSEWTLERTERQELREAAERIIADQTREIEQMTQWLQEWYGQGGDAMMAEMMQAENDMMMQEMMAAEDPDRAFLTAMTDHHNGALDMAQLALIRATNPELRTMARDIVVEQANEIHQFQEWLATW
jgi:uncharacterized protein (DUF305 family)